MPNTTPVALAITPVINIINNRAVTTSREIAKAFGKLHKNVVRKIETLECSPEFNALNFEPVKYKDEKGEDRPAYNITRDGFTFLAMGFTGLRAAQFKEAYINAFNLMEAELNRRAAEPKLPERMLMLTENGTVVGYKPLANNEIITSADKIAKLIRQEPHYFTDENLLSIIAAASTRLEFKTLARNNRR